MTRPERPPRGIVSVHDVMPETLDAVEPVLDRLAERGVSPVTLLVVPGREWSVRQLDRLRRREANGCILAGHGWVHEVAARNSLFHELHGRFLSRMVAEHLALDRQGIRHLIRRCRTWFAENDFRAPDLYVPPAWAMGAISRRDLERLPFERYETARGVYVRSGGRFLSQPLVGFEADTAVRAAFLRTWNRGSLCRARRTGRPLRIAIHPFDLDYPLREQLFEILDAANEFVDYRAVTADGFGDGSVPVFGTRGISSPNR